MTDRVSALCAILSDFKSNRVTALAATQVAACGLDIEGLLYVVNYELTNVPEDYVHRVGCTARAGSTGCAISLVPPHEPPLLRDIEGLLKRSLQFPRRCGRCHAGVGSASREAMATGSAPVARIGVGTAILPPAEMIIAPVPRVLPVAIVATRVRLRIVAPSSRATRRAASTWVRSAARWDNTGR